MSSAETGALDELDRGPIGAWITWAEHAVKGRVTQVLFQAGNLSTVLGLRLHDGREVVLKARPAAVRHVGCTAAQRHLHEAGYRCPLPLAMTPIGDHDVSLESHVPGGSQLLLDDAAPARFAAALAQLVRLTAELAPMPSLEPPPPWAAWDHHGAALWPPPASGPVDLDARQVPAWIDELGRRVRARLLVDSSPPVIGHVDFESQNIRWAGAQLHCVHDWDSVAARPEAAVAGLAAASFTAVDSVARAAAVRHSEEFLRAYALARGRPWSDVEVEVAWAAGLWALAYNARQECLSGGSALAERLARQAPERLRRARA